MLIDENQKKLFCGFEDNVCKTTKARLKQLVIKVDSPSLVSNANAII